MGFQAAVYIDPNPAVEGDFASANPRASVLAGPGQLVAGDNGLTVGRFAWVDANGKASNAGSGAPAGFVHREQQGLITIFLAEATMLVPKGLPVVLHNLGDFWAKTKTVATKSQKVFASLTDGTISTDAAGATVAGSIETKWYVASAGGVGDLIKITTTQPG